MRQVEYRKNGSKVVYILSGCILLALVLIFLRRPLLYAVKILSVSGILALLTYPLCKLYETRLPTKVGAALAILSAVIILILVAAAVAIPMTSGAAGLYQQIAEMTGPIIPLIRSAGIREKLSEISGSAGFISTITSVIMGITSGVVSFMGAVVDAILAMAVAWYMLVDRERIALYIELAIPSSHRQMVIRNAVETWIEMGLYLRGQAIIAICVGVLSSLGLYVVGIPYAVMLGITAGILNMIPYFGPVIACVPVGLLALGDGIIPALLAIGVLIAVQQIDGLILSPRIVGNSTGFSPVVIMVVVFAAGTVWGIPGMLLAIPVLIIIRTCVRVFVELGQND